MRGRRGRRGGGGGGAGGKKKLDRHNNARARNNRNSVCWQHLPRGDRITANDLPWFSLSAIQKVALVTRPRKQLARFEYNL